MDRAQIDNLHIGRRLFRAPGLIVHVGKSPGRRDLLVLKRLPSSVPERDLFSEIEALASMSGISVQERSPAIMTVAPRPAGTLADVFSTGWRLKRRLQCFRRLCERAQRFHQHGRYLGALPPDFVLLDVDFEPFIVGPRLASPNGSYAAPETVDHGEVDARSDTYSLGKLLYFVLAGNEPPQEDQDPPRLEELLDYPVGLARIVRKATSVDRERRYRDVGALLSDLTDHENINKVGLAHPEFDERVLRKRRAVAERDAKAANVDRDEIVAVPAPNRGLARRVLRALGLVFVIVGVGMASARLLRTTASLNPIPPSEAEALSPLVVSASISDSAPRVLLAKLRPEWDALSQAAKQDEIETIVERAAYNQHLSRAFFYRGEAVVAGYDGSRVILFTGTSDR